MDAGSADDPQGASGLAHMFEHMAFKGTDQIGTTNYPAEKVALAKVETPMPPTTPSSASASARTRRSWRSLKKAFEDAQDEAQKYVIPNQFTEIAEENGAVGLNASTAEDSTQYFWSMPANRLELWAYMESGRIGASGAARVLQGARRGAGRAAHAHRLQPRSARMVEQFLATAYVAHPYGRSGVGWESEISQVTATEAEAFHKKYYVPANIVIAVVGDVKASEAMPMLTKYFRRHPRRPEAGADDHGRAAAVCGEVRHHPRGDAAVLYRGLSPARLSRSRRLGL